ncbi:hypothetical protein [Streptomyces sp. NPDC058476]|uniref:hypothetical protein n=1 Tax=Streptomyces sp. NPDC058476 TaxID=3346519 RepID=UPI0036543CC1
MVGPVAGLGLGADDCLSEAFAFAELVARLRALARRARLALPPAPVRGQLRLDPARWQATRFGGGLALSPREFAVLGLPPPALGALVFIGQLLDGPGARRPNPFGQTVNVTVSRLLRKPGGAATDRDGGPGALGREAPHQPLGRLVYRLVVRPCARCSADWSTGRP